MFLAFVALVEVHYQQESFSGAVQVLCQEEKSKAAVSWKCVYAPSLWESRDEFLLFPH